MAELPELGRLTTVAVREVWAHEAHHFTQWLLQNADVLADLLGMDLELTEAEHRVGGFSLDIIGTDLQSNSTVIIENQLEPTDHGHLGQLMTYAGGTDPATIVWCAPRFRDEHRAALDWLNEHTVEGVRFFGVEIAAVKIADSPPAPMFRLVAQPNDWVKRVHTEKPAVISDSPRTQAHEALWRLVLDRIREERPTWTSARAASRESWITLPHGATGIWYMFTCSGQHPRVELYFGDSDADVNQEEYDKFVVHRAVLDEAFPGTAVDYQPLPGRKACRIAVWATQDFDVLDHSQHPGLADWFITTMDTFRPATQEIRRLITKGGPLAT